MHPVAENVIQLCNFQHMYNRINVNNFKTSTEVIFIRVC